MKKELITEIRRIREMMMINEGLGTVFRGAFRSTVAEPKLLSLLNNLETGGDNVISRADNNDFSRKIKSSADDFSDALDQIERKIFAISDDDLFIKYFDELLEALDTNYRTKLTDDLDDIDQVHLTGGDVDGEIYKKTLGMDDQYGEAYTRRLKKKFLPQTNTTVLRDPIPVSNKFVDDMAESSKAKKLIPDNTQRQNFFNMFKQEFISGKRAPIETVGDALKFLDEAVEFFEKMNTPISGTGRRAEIESAERMAKFKRMVEEFKSYVTSTMDGLFTALGALGKGIVGGIGNFASWVKSNGFRIFMGTLVLCLFVGAWEKIKTIPILGPILQSGADEVSEWFGGAVDAADEAVRNNGGGTSGGGTSGGGTSGGGTSGGGTSGGGTSGGGTSGGGTSGGGTSGGGTSGGGTSGGGTSGGGTSGGGTSGGGQQGGGTTTDDWN